MVQDIHFIGTSHIAKQSVDEIAQAVTQYKPDIIAVELDMQRAEALFKEQPTSLSPHQISKIGVKGYLFAKFGQKIQQRLGKMVGVAPGSEMKAAIQEAKKANIPVAFIDQPIQITLRKLSQKITWRERFRFALDLVKGIIFPKKQLQKWGWAKFDLRTVPEKKVILAMMDHFRTRYPSLYYTLVEERNIYMVKKLVRLLRENPGKKILVIVGAGHEKGMKELLLKVDV